MRILEKFEQNQLMQSQLLKSVERKRLKDRIGIDVMDQDKKLKIEEMKLGTRIILGLTDQSLKQKLTDRKYVSNFSNLKYKTIFQNKL